MAQLASTLSILVGSGVPVVTALAALAGVLTNLPMREALERATRAVEEGASLSRALAASRLFPPVMVHLIASGEASGRLPETLGSAARQQQNEVTIRVTAFAAPATHRACAHEVTSRQIDFIHAPTPPAKLNETESP